MTLRSGRRYSLFPSHKSARISDRYSLRLLTRFKVPGSSIRSISTMKQYLRSIHKIQLEFGGDGQGVFESRQTNEVVAQVVNILDIPGKELEAPRSKRSMRTRYNCEEEDKDVEEGEEDVNYEEEGMRYIPASLLLPVFYLVLT
jgi:hypothetical protein